MILGVIEITVEFHRVKKAKQVTDISQKYMGDVKGNNLESLQHYIV